MGIRAVVRCDVQPCGAARHHGRRGHRAITLKVFECKCQRRGRNLQIIVAESSGKLAARGRDVDDQDLLPSQKIIPQDAKQSRVGGRIEGDRLRGVICVRERHRADRIAAHGRDAAANAVLGRLVEGEVLCTLAARARKRDLQRDLRNVDVVDAKL